MAPPAGWYSPELSALSLGQLWRVAPGCATFAVGVVLFKVLRLPTTPTSAIRYPTRLRRVEADALPAAARGFFAGFDGRAAALGFGPAGFRYLASVRAAQASAGAVWLALDRRSFLHVMWADAPGPERLVACSARPDGRHVVTTSMRKELGDGTLADVERLPPGTTLEALAAAHQARCGGVAPLDLERVEALLVAQNDDVVESLAPGGVLVRIGDEVARGLAWPPAALAGDLFDGA